MGLVYIMVPAGPANSAGRHPKGRITTEGGSWLHFPFAPVEVDHGGSAGSWVALERPGRKPITRESGPGLRTLSFTSLWGYTDHQVSIEPSLSRLAYYARGSGRVTLSLGVAERGWWNITDLSVTVLARRQGTNEATRANVSMTFTEANPVRVSIGRTVVRPPRRKTPTSKGPAKTSRTYTVRSGDTLSSIAQRALGKASRFPEIAKLNKLKNVHDIKVGRVLHLPAR